MDQELDQELADHFRVICELFSPAIDVKSTKKVATGNDEDDILRDLGSFNLDEA